MEKVPMLAEGYEKLTADLKALRAERPLIVDAIEEARAHGDSRRTPNTMQPRNARARSRRRSPRSRTRSPVRRSSIPRPCRAIA